MTTLQLARLCKKLALDKKAENPVILDLSKLEGPAECFVVCSGLSAPQLKAIAEGVEKGVKEEAGLRPSSRDGRGGSNWIILDYGSVLVHVMHPESRSYYGLEALWQDAPKVK